MTAHCKSNSEPEWRFKSFKERLAYACTEKLFTDITICVNFVGKEHVFKAHKCILAHFSSVFEKMFYVNAGRNLSHIELSGVDPQGLAYVLKQLYHVPHSPRKDIDRSLLITAYHAAMSLSMSQLETDLKQEILDQVLTHSLITRDDFWKILELSLILKLEDITDRLLRFAESNSREVLRAKSLTKASPTTLKEVLELDRLKISEGEVLNNIFRWKEENLQSPFVDQFVKDLLGCVRFRNLSSLDLCQFVASKSNLISRDDVLGIMMHLGNPALSPLPAWCSTKFRFSITCPPNDSVTDSKIKTSSNVSDSSKGLSFNVIQRSLGGLLNMYVEQKHADVCFIVGSEKIPMKAHRNVLALGSIVFEKMFFGPLADPRYEIEVPTQDPEGFEKMLMYFYDDSNPDSLFKKPDVAIKTFEAALKYGSTNLKEICGKLKNFWKQLDSKKLLSSKGDKSLKKLLDYAERNTKDVLECPDFLNATQDAVKLVLRLDNLNMKEIHVLKNTVRYLKHNFPTRKSESVKYELLSLVRFDDISVEEFCSFMEMHDTLLPKAQSLSILMHLQNRSLPLPNWCHKGPSRTLSNVPQSYSLTTKSCA